MLFEAKLSQGYFCGDRLRFVREFLHSLRTELQG